MSVLKSISKYFASKFLTKDDLLPELLDQMTQQEVGTFIRAKLSKDIPAGYDRYSKGYIDALHGAQNLVLTHYGVATISDLAYAKIHEFAGYNWFARVAIDKILQQNDRDNSEAVAENGVSVTWLLHCIDEARKEADVENNYVKKRALIRKAVSTARPKLGTDKVGLVTELVLSL